VSETFIPQVWQKELLHQLQGNLIMQMGNQSSDDFKARQAARKAEHAAKIEAINARLQKAPAALQPIIAHHSRSGYDECAGCDAGAYAESGADWPCSTIDLILDGLHE
jgi:hypothetical protein